MVSPTNTWFPNKSGGECGKAWQGANIRTVIAMHCLQGLLQNECSGEWDGSLGKRAVMFADELIAELNERALVPPPPPRRDRDLPPWIDNAVRNEERET